MSAPVKGKPPDASDVTEVAGSTGTAAEPAPPAVCEDEQPV
jgi:hypothetical protein